MHFIIRDFGHHYDTSNRNIYPYIIKLLMAINIDTIGQMAGLVWGAVAEADTLSTKQIKKITKLKDKELYSALGWLAREGKISFQTSAEDEKELLIQLVK